ncbi:MAG TPA: alcohol dehydrogenase catalytic domain-containing protein [Victivallales bacterium]|nr:alcohol dehydrogenase catalytic domain-containing protein [Victivallales bacterium]
MKAIVYVGKDTMEVRDEKIPALGSGQILLKNHYASICGTDMHILAGKHPRVVPPLIMGHEGSSEVAKIDPSVKTNLKVGDKVVVEPLISCGKCYACKTGLQHICHTLGLYGIDKPGLFAEYVAVDADRVFKVPESMPLDVAALLEPIAVAVHSVRMSNIKLGDRVCVQGAGPIGILTALMAKKAGATRVMISDMQEFRLNLAKQYGLETIDMNKQNIVEEVKKATDGWGADVVFEVVGISATSMLSPDLCRVRGNICAVSHPKEPLMMNMLRCNFKEIYVTTVRVYEMFDFTRAIEIATSSGIDFSKLLSRPYSLDEAPAAFDAAKKGNNVMKVVFKI